jgi:autotransporter-associated beta strand protein
MPLRPLPGAGTPFAHAPSRPGLPGPARLRALLLSTALVICLPEGALAQSQWIGSGGTGDFGLWGTAGHWNPAGVPNASGAVVEFDLNPGVLSNINLNGGAFTVGILRIATPAEMIVNSLGAGGTLNFQVPAGSALIQVTNSNTVRPFFASTPQTFDPLTVNFVSNTIASVAGGQLLWFGDATTLGGAGDFGISGTGTVRIDAASTRSGTTFFNGGTVDIRNAGALGTGAASFFSGTLRANTTGTVTNGIVVESGGSSRIVAGDGQTVTLTGGVNVNAGAVALQFGEAGNTGVIDLASNAGSASPNYTVDVLGGTLRGTSLILPFLMQNATATNVAAGATLDIAAGTFGIRNLQSQGSVVASTDVLIGGGLASGTISGGGGVTIATPGTINGVSTGLFVLTGAATHAGGTTVESGATLQLGNGGTTGSLAGNVANAGTLAFNRSNAYTFGGAISGTGAVRQNGAGTTTLSALNTYTGATTVNAGTLAIANGGSIVSNTTVNGGTFQVNGTAAGVTVNGGTLGGTGMVGNTTLNGGTLAAGNSIGTLNVQGSLVFTAASTYLVEVDPVNADRTNVNGTATLGGARVSAVFAPGAYVNRRYNILSTGGGVVGTFGALVNTNLPANFTSQLSYDSNNAFLDLTLNFTPTPPPAPPGSPPPPTFPPLTINQRNVANGLINSFNTAGGIPLVFGTLNAAGLTQVSGEHATGTQQTTFDAMDRFINVMTDPFMGTRAGRAPQTAATGYADEEALAYAGKRKGTGAEQDAYAKMAVKAPPRVNAFERRWSVWGAGYGGTQSTDGNDVTGSQRLTNHVYGGAAGLDYRLTPETMVGFSLGGAGTNFSVENLGGGRSEMFQAGVYGRHTMGPAYLAGALAWGWQDITTNRTVFGNVYRGDFDANALSGRLEGGYRVAYGSSGITPYAAGQFTSFWQPDFAEQTIAGVNTFALAYSDRNVTSSRSELGLRGDTSFAAADAVVTLRGRAAWAHNFNTTRSIDAIFQTLPASGFTVFGAAQARDSALVTASAETKWLNGFSVAATFEGEFSRVTDSYAGKGVIRYQW